MGVEFIIVSPENKAILDLSKRGFTISNASRGELSQSQIWELLPVERRMAKIFYGTENLHGYFLHRDAIDDWILELYSDFEECSYYSDEKIQELGWPLKIEEAYEVPLIKSVSDFFEDYWSPLTFIQSDGRDVVFNWLIQYLPPSKFEQWKMFSVFPSDGKQIENKSYYDVSNDKFFYNRYAVPKIWISKLYSFVANDQKHKAINFLFEKIDDLMCINGFQEIDELLLKTDVSRLDTNLCVAFLSILNPGKHKLKHYSKFKEQITERLKSLTPERFERLIKGR